jgi:NitT/TauT family transport system ATP-binding protein
MLEAMNDRTKAFLLIEDVYKQYGDKMVLDNVDLAVDKGEFCTVIGPSGCGKSTLLRLILGQEDPTSGIVRIDGQPDGYADARRGIVYQKYSLFPHLTVLENVLLGLKLHAKNWRVEKKAATEQAMAFLKRVRMEDAASKYPHELSGGMQQRVAIVQAMITKPKILLMDEPFAALDPPTREQLQMFTLELWDENQMTVFFVTHDVSEALFLGTRLLLLSQYYVDDRGDYRAHRHGAKIVMDVPLQRELYRVSDKNTPDFREMRDRIMRSGFSADYLKHVDEFDLRHPNSFRTLTFEESHKNGVHTTVGEVEGSEVA